MSIRKDVFVPLDVPRKSRSKYIKNYLEATKGSDHLMLFAGDQKVEHLNSDFFGKGVAVDDCVPDHLFQIASRAKIGVFAAQFGLISRYAMNYADVPYLVKMNSKTNLVGGEPISTKWVDVDDVVKFSKRNKLNVVGIGYTIYLGSENESVMLAEASKLIRDAHEHGLITVIWMYPRGKNVKDEKSPAIIAGACGVASCLGSDFVKVNFPVTKKGNAFDAFKEAVYAAGRTKVVCAGGSSGSEKKFLETLYDQIHISGSAGNATGRNVHQKSLVDAVKFCDAIYAVTVDGKTAKEAYAIYKSK